MDIIRRALGLFDQLIVGVAINSRKQSMFTPDERQAMIKDIFKDEPRIVVDAFEGLTVEYARNRGACVVVRGLRAVADFEYELQMANMNRHLSGEIVTVFIMANDAYFYVSSNLCKEVCRLGGDVSKLVPTPVDVRLLAKLNEGK
jgi:pantetheine-phosphate adenylyltransferase